MMLLAVTIACLVGTVALTALSARNWRRATKHQQASTWHWQQAALWYTDPDEALRRKANPPEYVSWSAADIEGKKATR